MLPSPSSTLETHPARPPTPPKNHFRLLNDKTSFVEDSDRAAQSIDRSLILLCPSDDPKPGSPQTSQATTIGLHASKKVGFSPHLSYHKIAAPGQHGSPAGQLLKRMPSSRDTKPLRSILKQSDVAPPLTPDDLEARLSYFSPENPGAFAKMLQSVIQQLAGPSITSRRDAYLTLNGALKAYEGVPDHDAMTANMSLLMQFMTRDMTWKNAGVYDINVITQALKLAGAVLYDTRLSAALDDDFRTFLIDRSIAVLEQAEMPKAIVRAHMFLLAQQRFHSSIMTASRADKLVSILHTIEDRCSGNAAVATRLVIYQRLLDKNIGVMANRVRDWVEHVFHGMLSSITDVRIRAIETCTLAGTLLGTQSHVAKALNEMFDTEVEEGQSYCDYLSLRLMSMISDQDMGPSVPQIWSAIIMCFRNKWRPLGKWSRIKNWLLILQKCLNASDVNTKYQAHLAWNKLVFGVMPGSSTSRNMFSMLKVPVFAGMERKGSDRHSKLSRQCAWDSYYNLLHYGLRPGLTHEELDAAWDMYVEPAFSETIKTSGRGRNAACRVLSGLFTSSKGLWNPNAANETAPIKPEDLPKLDPRWVRSRFSRPLGLLEPMIQSGMWSPKESNAVVVATLRSLVECVAEAGTQEVKTSSELKEAVTMMVSMLQRLWSNATEPPPGAESNAWIERYGALVAAIIQGTGSSPFAEDILTLTKDDRLEASNTPSHRPSKHYHATQSPLVFLFGQLYRPPSSSVVSVGYLDLARMLLDHLVSCRVSMSSRLDLLNRSTLVWSSITPSNTDGMIAGKLWSCVASCAEQIVTMDEPRVQSHESQHMGHSLRDATQILMGGVKYASLEKTAESAMISLYCAMAQTAAATAGASGQVLAVIEPVAKALLTETHVSHDRAELVLASRMLASACWPRSRQDMEQARKILWGVALASHKASVFDPYEHLYVLVVKLMVHAYGTLDDRDDGDMEPLTELVSFCVAFIQACPRSLLPMTLRKLQEGFVVWIEDKSRCTLAKPAVTETVLMAWQALLRLLESLPQQDTILLKALEPLLVAGFSSPHKTIVNATILFWNDNFGHQSKLEYPPRIQAVLRARLVETDLVLPDFPESNGHDVPASLPPFYESQVEVPDSGHANGVARALRSDVDRVPSTAPAAYLSAKKSLKSRPATVSSPAKSASKPLPRSTPKVRLRHDDSQLQFAQIDSSSPIRLDDESQHLTEHQKDVRKRQAEGVQMFPDLSSSPPTRQPSPPRSVQKRLDFTPKVISEENEAVGTPTALLDPSAPLSDDIPSSPTPTAARNAAVHIGPNDGAHDDAEATDDPPSSPPARPNDEKGDLSQTDGQVHEFGPDATTVLDTGFHPDAAELDDIAEGSADDHVHSSDGLAVEIGPLHITSDLPSDTVLPTMQLQEEEKKAADLERLSGKTAHTVDDADEGGESISENPPKERKEVKGSCDGDITRVEDSFPTTTSPHPGATGSVESSQQSQRASRKRKRAVSTANSAKKITKQQSPFNRLMSSFGIPGFLSRSQEEDDDISDEIIVASSQISASSTPTKAAAATGSQAKKGDKYAVSVQEQSGSLLEDEMPGSKQAARRRRNKKRKSETPTPAPSQTEPHLTRSLKRRASALSIPSDAETNVATPSVIKDTPAPAKAKRQRKGPDAKLVEEAQSRQETGEIARSNKRAVTAVVISNESETGVPRVSKGNSSQGESSNSSERPVTTPKSLLNQLKGILSVLPRMVLGSQEEWDVDSVLFEIRRETHEARRRGRAQG